MRAMTVLAAIFAAAATNAHAQAHAPEHEAYTNSTERAAARAIAESMPSLQYPWQLEWSAFDTYGDDAIVWFLAPPEPYEPAPPPAGVTRRRGMISARGSLSVSVCGDDERIGALMLETSHIWLGDRDLKPELEALGLTVHELERREPHPLFEEALSGAWAWPDWIREVSGRTRYRLYRLELAGHEPAFLTAGYLCTPPGTRHATHCSMTWTAEFRAGEQPRDEPCVAPPTPPASARPS